MKLGVTFLDYGKFLKERKLTRDRLVAMGKHPRKNNAIGSTEIVYGPVTGQKRLEAEISVENNRKYHIRIFAAGISQSPCFRFDSQGIHHCNPETGTGLKKRQVTTPHFQKFNEDGVEIAYKTAKLKSKSKCEAIVNSYKLGFKHFCEEANLRCQNRAYPDLALNQEEMNLSHDDPLNGVSFNEQH